MLFSLIVAGMVFSNPTFAQSNPFKEPLVVHEWGTFTSLQGSNGEVQDGMQHEDEALPKFVHGRDPLHETRKRNCINPKCFEDIQNGNFQVTQKMETPVIYFYSQKDQKINVTVDFPNGIISQYFPKPIDFRPSIGQIDGLRNGSVDFQIETTKNPLSLPKVPDGNIYGPARMVNSDFIKMGDENEKFIFYRGLGHFSTSLQATSKGGNLTIRNRGAEGYPAVFLIHSDNKGGFIKPLGTLSGASTLQISAQELAQLQASQQPFHEYVESAIQLLTSELKATGLYQDEALAMANTWTTSYFKTPGLRVLYILSREETDQILPLRVQPQPSSLVRTMVGRVEIFLDTDEAQLQADVKKEGKRFKIKTLGRLAEPKLRRVRELTSQRNELKILNALINQARWARD